MKDDGDFQFADLKEFGVFVRRAGGDWRLMLDGPIVDARDVYNREHDLLQPGEMVLLIDGSNWERIAGCEHDRQGQRLCEKRER